MHGQKIKKHESTTMAIRTTSEDADNNQQSPSEKAHKEKPHIYYVMVM